LGSNARFEEELTIWASGAKSASLYVFLMPSLYFTVTEAVADGIPFAITTSVLAPVSAFDGTSKFVETVLRRCIRSEGNKLSRSLRHVGG